VDERDDATQATTALVAAVGVWAVRVHAVRAAVDAVRVAAAVVAARRQVER
jgi:dihydropteroate synthase